MSEELEQVPNPYPKTWWEEGGPNELRFVLWGIPHVIQRQEQYLVCLQGLPPQRKIIHLAVIGRVGKQPDGVDSVVEWVKRSGILGLMSKAEAGILCERLAAWWPNSTGATTQPPGTKE